MNRAVKVDKTSRSFGRALREIRESQGLSLRQLADASGTSTTYLSVIERDEVPVPHHRRVSEIERGLNIPPGSLQPYTGRVAEWMTKVILERPTVMWSLILNVSMLNDDEVELLANLAGCLRGQTSKERDGERERSEGDD